MNRSDMKMTWHNLLAIFVIKHLHHNSPWRPNQTKNAPNVVWQRRVPPGPAGGAYSAPQTHWNSSRLLRSIVDAYGTSPDAFGVRRQSVPVLFSIRTLVATISIVITTALYNKALCFLYFFRDRKKTATAAPDIGIWGSEYTRNANIAEFAKILFVINLHIMYTLCHHRLHNYSIYVCAKDTVLSHFVQFFRVCAWWCLNCSL